MNERQWLVLFLRWRIHWTMRWIVRRRPGHAHVVLLSPLGNSQWLLLQWGMDGLFVRPAGGVEAARLVGLATEVIEYHSEAKRESSVLNSLLPNTCMTVARQALGLPARWNFFRSGWQLRCELLARGAQVVMPATGRAA